MIANFHSCNIDVNASDVIFWAQRKMNFQGKDKLWTVFSDLARNSFFKMLHV